ncbi:MAG: CoA pyrophosphatase [Burkholderiaceae bacterium]
MSDATPLTPLSKLPNFDPRNVPVSRVDAQLPEVDSQQLAAAALVSRFRAPPAWTPEIAFELSYSHRSPVHAAVLVPIVMRDRPTVLLTERASHLSTHSGQIAFPGGKHDVDDSDMVATALREAHEEVGLAPEFIRVIGQLPIYVTGTAFVITPVVALIRDGFALKPSAHEVEAVFEVPLHFLMNPANHRWHQFVADGVRRQWLSMPYDDGGQERFIWGATAGMLRNMYRFLAA